MLNKIILCFKNITYLNQLRIYAMLIVLFIIIPILIISYVTDIPFLGFIACMISLVLGYLIKVYEI